MVSLPVGRPARHPGVGCARSAMWRSHPIPNETERLPRRVVELVEFSCQPTEADMEGEIAVPEMTVEEAARCVLAPADVVWVPWPCP